MSSNSDYASSENNEEDKTQSIKYRATFYLDPVSLTAYNGGEVLKINQEFELLTTSNITFQVKPEAKVATLFGRRYTAEAGDIIDAPQLYRTFRCYGKIYGQVLGSVCRFTGTEVEWVADIPGPEIVLSEQGYGRLCLLDNRLLISSGPTLHIIDEKGNVSDILQLEKADMMVFSDKSNTIAFDLNSQFIYQVKYHESKAELIKICETECQQLLFAGQYVILSDGLYPVPLIEAYCMKTNKLQQTGANWFQDNFWEFLCIKNETLDLGDDVMCVLNQKTKQVLE